MVDPKSSGESSGIPEKVNRFASGPSRLPALFPGVYVGASSTERELAFQYAEKLRDAGARITYARWETRQKFQNDAALSLENPPGITARHVFRIPEAVRVWLLLPGRREGVGRRKFRHVFRLDGHLEVETALDVKRVARRPSRVSVSSPEFFREFDGRLFFVGSVDVWIRRCDGIWKPAFVFHEMTYWLLLRSHHVDPSNTNEKKL